MATCQSIHFDSQSEKNAANVPKSEYQTIIMTIIMNL